MKNGLAELYDSEYPKMDKASRKRLRLNKAVKGSFEKRLKILSEAIKEINLDIQEREGRSQQVQDKIDGYRMHLDFIGTKYYGTNRKAILGEKNIRYVVTS